jgi:hypothetical protein
MRRRLKKITMLALEPASVACDDLTMFRDAKRSADPTGRIAE